nr:hypothetical protein [Bacteroidota bacterium]
MKNNVFQFNLKTKQYYCYIYQLKKVTQKLAIVKKIRILIVVFDTEIKGYEIPAFRGAIVEKVGRDSILFHNHINGNGFLYKYPLIQYKCLNRKPAIVCVELGVDEIHKYFENKSWDIQISDRWLNMKIDRLNLNQFTMQVGNKRWEYTITNWIALNQENYQKYLTIESLAGKLLFLENILKANILSFAKGIDWMVDKPVEISIKDLRKARPVTLKGNKVMGFNADFSSNVFLPNYIGLGKSVSMGFGVVKSLNIDTIKDY